MPLVILLHMLTYTGGMEEDYMKFRPLAEQRGFLYCYPTARPTNWAISFGTPPILVAIFGIPASMTPATCAALLKKLHDASLWTGSRFT